MKHLMIGIVILAHFACEANAEVLRFPALFDVDGVSADDVLNVRSEPDGSGEILATLAPDREGVEVLRLSDDARWARVGLGEISGWVSARYLTERSQGDVGKLPVPMRCFGVEPFWGLHLTPDGRAEFEQMPDPEQSFELTYQGVPEGRLPDDILAALAADTARATLFLRREMCSDGMSDREFGLSVRILLERDGQNTAYAGCCTLTGG